MISVLLPSRKRLGFLLRCIKSLRDTASSQNNFEICLRIHRDDRETIQALPQILGLCTVRVVIGLQHNGYNDLNWFYQEAEAISRGSWMWVMNDDIVCQSKNWDKLVLGLTPDRVAIPKDYYLGESLYKDDEHNPFMFWPRRYWQKFGMKQFIPQFDQKLWELREKNNIPLEKLPIKLWHDHRPDDHKIERLDEKAKNYDNDPHESHMENL
jgi:hypothetical protein